MKYLPLITTLFLTACATNSPSVGMSGQVTGPIPKEKHTEFRSVGAVISFQELCLNKLSTTSGKSSWETIQSSNEISQSPLKKSPKDKAYLIGSDFTKFVLVSHSAGGCSVFASNSNGMSAHETLQKVFLEYKNKYTGSRIKVTTISKGPVSTHEVILLSKDNEPLIQTIVSLKPEAHESSFLALTGVNLDPHHKKM